MTCLFCSPVVRVLTQWSHSTFRLYQGTRNCELCVAGGQVFLLNRDIAGRVCSITSELMNRYRTGHSRLYAGFYLRAPGSIWGQHVPILIYQCPWCVRQTAGLPNDLLQQPRLESNIGFSSLLKFLVGRFNILYILCAKLVTWIRNEESVFVSPFVCFIPRNTWRIWTALVDYTEIFPMNAISLRMVPSLHEAQLNMCHISKGTDCHTQKFCGIVYRPH
jgi:hypothetical protein